MVKVVVNEYPDFAEDCPFSEYSYHNIYTCKLIGHTCPLCPHRECYVDEESCYEEFCGNLITIEDMYGLRKDAEESHTLIC